MTHLIPHRPPMHPQILEFHGLLRSNRTVPAIKPGQHDRMEGDILGQCHCFRAAKLIFTHRVLQSVSLFRTVTGTPRESIRYRSLPSKPSTRRSLQKYLQSAVPPERKMLCKLWQHGHFGKLHSNKKAPTANITPSAPTKTPIHLLTRAITGSTGGWSCATSTVVVESTFLPVAVELADLTDSGPPLCRMPPSPEPSDDGGVLTGHSTHGDNRRFLDSKAQEACTQERQ